MPFDTLTLQLTCFLCWITLLSSYPTNTYFHSWHDGPDSYRLSPKSFLKRTDGGFEGQVLPLFSFVNTSQRKGETNFPTDTPTTFPHNPNPGYHQGQVWYPFNNERPRSYYPQPVYPPPQPEFGRSDQVLSRRDSDTFRSVNGDEYSGNAENHGNSYGVQNFDNTYSSHVNCQVENQNERETKVTAVPSRNPDEEGINFDESSRHIRNGSPREVDLTDLRVVTPKGGVRRPTQGSGGKHQTNPLSHGGTNVISTTFRNQTQKGSKRPRPNGGKPQSGDIVFPDGYHRPTFTPRLSKCGKKSTFCEQIGEDYPSEYINQILKKEGAMFREFFGKDVISDPNITERIHAPEENSLCPYRQEVVFPRAAKNKEDKWLFVVNQDQYVQGVTVEVCLNPESRCILTEGFPLGYTPYCKQKYIERRLVAIGEDGKPHSDSFRLPSCCNCVVKHETSARMNLSPRSSRETPPPFETKPPISL